MNEIMFKIVLSGIIGLTVVPTIIWAIYYIYSADSWKDRLAGVFILLVAMCMVGMIYLLWCNVSIKGLE